jgi:OmcA/MtrC family decaheme c-type cytochrome
VGQPFGEWSAQALVDGTYTLSVWASKPQDYVELFGTHTTYRLTSEAATAQVLVGDALTPEPYALIDDLGACNACHQDIEFHDRHARGFASCLACRGNSGGEDLPRYVAANAPETPGARIDLRSMVHKIHHARLLDDPAAFELVGAGPDPYPDNFEVSTFASILLPAQPGATKNCAKCHGPASTTWQAPATPLHPDPDVGAVLAWKRSCNACHDSSAALAHIDSQTSPAGGEACAICHGPGEELAVENVHRPR